MAWWDYFREGNPAMSRLTLPTEDRAQRARNIMDTYLSETGDSRRNEGHLADLLADLMHMAATDTDNWPEFEDALATARINFEAEQSGEE
jgi:hypothetical protein